MSATRSPSWWPTRSIEARDAAEAIAIEWEALPHVIGAVAALAEGRAVGVAEATARGNLAFETELGDAERHRARLRRGGAHGVAHARQPAARRQLSRHPRGRRRIRSADRITLTLSSQGSHSVRDVLCDDVLKIAPDKMRVVTPDVGGGFGTKLFPYREYALAAVAARQLRRPVKWVADRSEHFLGDAQGRDNVTTAKLALDGDGRFLALDVDLVADMGAYLSCYAPFIPFIGAGMSPGVYDIPACHVRVRGVFTNTVPVDAYRGAGRPEAAYVIERLVDVAAREIGIAPDALRRREFHQGHAVHDRDRQDLRFRRLRAATSRRRRSSPTGTASSGGWRNRARPDGCAASASRPISRPAATTGPTPRACGSTTTAASPCSSARNRPGRATPPPMPRSSPITSGLRPSACA